MIRFLALPVLLVVCAAFPARVQSAPPDNVPVVSGLPFAVGNREELTEDHLQVFTKWFLVAMMNHHDDKNANALRGFFDPRYLKRYGLTNRDLSAELAPVETIGRFDFADDKQTILCFVDTSANPNEPVWEAILLRVSVYEGNLYLSPLKAPDPKTGVFTPWILRTTSAPLGSGAVRKYNNSPETALLVGTWNVAFANGVTELCHIGNGGKAFVEESRRRSHGTAVVKDGSIVMTFQDDRVERWTSVGKRFVVEHWFPGSRFPTATPVLGIAERTP